MQKQTDRVLRSQFVELDRIYLQSIKNTTEPAWLLSRYHDNSYMPPFSVTAKQNKLIMRMQRLFQNCVSIRPESKGLMCWNFFMIIAIGFNFYQIPISLFFTSSVYQAEFESPIGLGLNALFTSVLLVNIIIVRPLTGYYQQGRLILSKKKIFTKYIKLQLWLNVIAWVVLFAYIFSNNSNFIYPKILFYLMTYSLYEIDNMISQKIQLYKIKFALYRFTRLILMLLFIILWLASIFFAIDYMYYQQKNQYYPVNLWLTNSICSQDNQLQFIDLVQTYKWYVWLNYAFYWTLQSVSMVGYGDITPRNPVEVAYCDLAIVLMTLMYAFFISTMWEILLQILQDQQHIQRKITKYFERNYKVKGQTAMKLGKYAYEAAQSKQRQQKQAQIYQNLSDELKNELNFARQRKFYITIQYFNELANFRQQYAELLHVLIPLNKQARYGEDEIILRQKQVGNVNLYSILQGQVQLTYENSKLFKFLGDREFFGVADFLIRRPSSYSVKSTKFTKILELSESDFRASVKKIVPIHQRNQQLYEEVALYNKYKLLGEDCWLCTSDTHATTECPQIFQWYYQIADQDLPKNDFSKAYKVAFRKYQKRKSIRSLKQCRKRLPKVKAIEKIVTQTEQVKSFRYYKFIVSKYNNRVKMQAQNCPSLTKIVQNIINMLEQP